MHIGTCRLPTAFARQARPSRRISVTSIERSPVVCTPICRSRRLVSPSTSGPAAVASSRAGSRRFGPHEAVDSAAVTDVVLCYDQNLTDPAAVLMESMVRNASGPLRFWILGRGLSSEYQEWLAGAFPDLPITFLPCDEVSYGANGRPARIPARITLSTMDRLLLPEMLDGVSRVVY